MKILIVYASRETGNTAKVAQAIADRLGPECSLFPVSQAPEPDGFDFIALGFGVYRGWPDGDMIAYMKRCRKKKVGLFMTLGAWPDSAPAANCLGRAEGLLADCTVCVKFACQGAYAPEFLARLQSLPHTSSHGWTPERARRITEAMKHPDAEDLTRAGEMFSAAVGKLRTQPSVTSSPIQKKAVAAVFFGSTVPRAREAYRKITEELEKSFPGIPVFQAYTSGIVRKRIGYTIPSLPELLKKLQLEGYTNVDVLAGLLSPGEEYHRLLRDVSAFSRNLACRVTQVPFSSLARMREFLIRVAAALPPERKPDEDVLFMGHGNPDGRADFIYMTAAQELAKIDPRFHLACVEGAPRLEEIIPALDSKKVYLVPFMLVAGDHALNDMAGEEEESWRSRLEAKGFRCECVLRGLGEAESVAALFPEYLKASGEA